MLELNFNPFPVLETDRLILRKFTKDDAAQLMFMRTDDRTMKYINKARPKTIDEVYALLTKIDGMIDNNEGIAWGMVLKTDQSLIGHISFHRVVKEHYRAEIGYMLHPYFWGIGLMSEAVTALVKFGFSSMKLHSIEAIINPENNASRQVLLKQGFTKEAYFKEDYFYDGIFYDSEHYGLVNP
ncbi:MAG: GNAT family N-acetyltransferase [Bacteroidetes bacterium]|nr:GNAT family N-acetyltransferase [Bacteroidota bacterium]